jgi:hypothetical protein
MRELNLIDVREDCEQEGFHYAMTGLSDYKEVKDAEFHRLRENYLKATKELGEYLRLDPTTYL